MAKDITLYSPDGSTVYYPKTVSDLVFNNENGKTLKDEIKELEYNSTFYENQITSDVLYSGGNYFINADGTEDETTAAYAFKKYDVSGVDKIVLKLKLDIVNVKRSLIAVTDKYGDFLQSLLDGGKDKLRGSEWVIDVSNIGEDNILWITNAVEVYTTVYSVRDKIKNDSYELSLSNLNLDITDYFLTDYICIANSTYLVKYVTPMVGWKCIYFKVTKGDSFKIENVKGGLNNGKVYGIYDNAGNLVECSTDEYVTKDITIEKDGVIIFNMNPENTGTIKITNIANLGRFKAGLDIALISMIDKKFDSINSNFNNIENNLERINTIINSELVDVEAINYTARDFIEGGYYNANYLGKLKVLNLISGWYYKFIDVAAGEQWELNVNGGNNARAWALLNANNEIVSFCQDSGLSVRNIVIPIGVVKMLVQTQTVTNAVYVKRIPHISRLTNTERKVNTLVESSFRTITETLHFNNSFGYNGVVGEAPTESTVSQYKSIRIPVKYGDVVDYKTFCGSSVPHSMLVKDGVVISIKKLAYGASNFTYTCDDTFDEVIINLYLDNENYIYHTKERATTDILTNDVEQLDNRVTVLENKTPKKSIKVLCFGNSFTQDSMCYVPHIMKNIAPDVELTLGIAYIGGCPLVQHYVNFSGEESTLDGKTYTVTNYLLHKSVNGSAWSNTSLNVDGVLNNDDWDIITFQQNGGSAAKDFNKYYAPYIYKIHKLLFNKLGGKSVKLGWISIHGTYASTDETILAHYNGVIANTKIIENTTGVSVVLPFGTAIQNLRTIEEIKNLGDTKYLLADGGHLQDGLGCLCAAYCNALKILECMGINNIGVIGEPTRITIDFLNEINTQGRNLGESNTVIGMDNEQYIYLAQIAAHKAILKPYEITDLNSCNV